ncbi:hypothetical protein L6R52_42870 [Myxococcota bacterium]|nr:hypothetical protein [Myxococcota bacterium]
MLAEIERRRAPLAEVIPRLSPRFVAPYHLAPLLDALELARTQRVRRVVSLPPRHAKTETILHWIASYLRRHPDRTVAYVSYAADLAHSKSRRARQLAEANGVPLDPTQAAAHEWRSLAGGGMLATGIGGPLTGKGCHVLVIDDPIKNRVEAESALARKRAWEWLTDVGLTRLEPDGSAFIVQTRWHPDDPAGRAIDGYEKTERWPCLVMPAIDDEGHALWPERFSVEQLSEIRAAVGEYTWASLFQGRPRPRGGAVFGAPTFATTDPPTGLRIVYGIDLAFTAKTSADWSVAAKLGGEGYGLSMRVWWLDLVRAQERPSAFLGRLKAARAATPGAKLVMKTGGQERGVTELMDALGGVFISSEPAVGDKFVRAQPFAAAWNSGQILLPANAPPWVADVVGELGSFTGINDDCDDIVDAAANGFDELSGGAASRLTVAMEQFRKAG